MGTMNAEGIALIGQYKTEALVEMMKVAIETNSEIDFTRLIAMRLDRENDEQIFAVYPTRDLPLNEDKDQYLWDWGMVGRKDGHVSLNGGILYSQTRNKWSSHT